MDYLHWDQKTISDFSGASVSDMYEKGFVFTRIGRGVMQQTRSVRIDLSRFALSSENRRILKKTDNIHILTCQIPLEPYDFAIAKLAKDFYSAKFGPSIMSAQKVKEMLTDSINSNFNQLLKYVVEPLEIGYAICYENDILLHYSYPFYDLIKAPKDAGLGMMIRAIGWAKSEGKKYVYLGSLQRPADTYKLQFDALEWFDGGPNGSGKWITDIEPVKDMLKSISLK